MLITGAGICNQESAVVLRKYLPKSYNVTTLDIVRWIVSGIMESYHLRR